MKNETVQLEHQKVTKHNREGDDAMLLTVRDAALSLGLREITVRKMMRSRSISFTRIGRAVRISQQEVERVISRGTVPALNVTSAGQNQNRKVG
jgi:excisionase family DNA binding protein